MLGGRSFCTSPCPLKPVRRRAPTPPSNPLFPLSPLFPLDTRISSVSPLFPLDTKTCGGRVHASTTNLQYSSFNFRLSLPCCAVQPSNLSLIHSAGYSPYHRKPREGPYLQPVTIYSKRTYIINYGRRADILAGFLMGCGGKFFGSRLLPQVDVGLEVLHHAGELAQFEGLGAIADGFLWCGMGFDDQAIGADGYTCASDSRHQAALSGGVAGIEDHR